MWHFGINFEMLAASFTSFYLSIMMNFLAHFENCPCDLQLFPISFSSSSLHRERKVTPILKLNIYYIFWYIKFVETYIVLPKMAIHHCILRSIQLMQRIIWIELLTLKNTGSPCYLRFCCSRICYSRKYWGFKVLGTRSTFLRSCEFFIYVIKRKTF